LLDIYKNLIRRRIKEKFNTIENFSKHTNIPRTTINFVLKNGVNASNFAMVSKILKELEIYHISGEPIALSDDLLEFIKMYNLLDDVGKHTVKSVAKTEYMRLHSDAMENAFVAAYGSIASSKPLTDDEKQILDLVEKIKKEDND